VTEIDVSRAMETNVVKHDPFGVQPKIRRGETLKLWDWEYVLESDIGRLTVHFFPKSMLPIPLLVRAVIPVFGLRVVDWVPECRSLCYILEDFPWKKLPQLVDSVRIAHNALLEARS